MGRSKSSVLGQLVRMPWWVSVSASLGCFILVSSLPHVPFSAPILNDLAREAPQIAPFFALVLLIPAPISFYRSIKQRRLLDQQTGPGSLRNLSWSEFESLVAEIFRRKGYSVSFLGLPGADGGVDARLAKGGKTYLVQCKHWKSRKVGVAVVREMFGLMSAEKASCVFIVTSGTFTEEARKFASGKPLELLDGPALHEMIQITQRQYLEREEKELEELPTHPKCPRCGRELFVRKARRGPHLGKEFLGCSGFPDCRYTHEMVF